MIILIVDLSEPLTTIFQTLLMVISINEHEEERKNKTESILTPTDPWKFFLAELIPLSSTSLKQEQNEIK